MLVRIQLLVMLLLACPGPEKILVSRDRAIDAGIPSEKDAGQDSTVDVSLDVGVVDASMDAELGCSQPADFQCSRVIEENCCERPEVEPFCEDGEWICPPETRPSSECSAFYPQCSFECQVMEAFWGDPPYEGPDWASVRFGWAFNGLSCREVIGFQCLGGACGELFPNGRTSEEGEEICQAASARCCTEPRSLWHADLFESLAEAVDFALENDRLLVGSEAADSHPIRASALRLYERARQANRQARLFCLSEEEAEQTLQEINALEWELARVISEQESEGAKELACRLSRILSQEEESTIQWQLIHRFSDGLFQEGNITLVPTQVLPEEPLRAGRPYEIQVDFEESIVPLEPERAYVWVHAAMSCSSWNVAPRAQVLTHQNSTRLSSTNVMVTPQLEDSNCDLILQVWSRQAPRIQYVHTLSLRLGETPGLPPVLLANRQVQYRVGVDQVSPLSFRVLFLEAGVQAVSYQVYFPGSDTGRHLYRLSGEVEPERTETFPFWNSFGVAGRSWDGQAITPHPLNFGIEPGHVRVGDRGEVIVTITEIDREPVEVSDQTQVRIPFEVVEPPVLVGRFCE